MGCGSSGNVIAPSPEQANGHKLTNGHNGHNSHDDDLPTVVLPDTPIKSKPPISFEIPIEEFNSNHRPMSPPPHLQRLLQPPNVEISLPHIEEKLADAEQRRQAILQQRAASAHKKSQKVTKNFHDMKSFDKTRDYEGTKHNTLIVPIDPGLEDKYI